MASCSFFLGYLAFASLGLTAVTDASIARHKRQTSTPLTAQLTTSTSHHSIDELYCSVAMSARMCDRLNDFDTTSVKLQNVARGLSPAVVRVGGTFGNFLIYQEEDGSVTTDPNIVAQWENTFNTSFYTGVVGKKNWSNFNCTGPNYEQLTNFYTNVGWKATYQISDLLRSGDYWDAFNAKKLVRYMRNNNLPVLAYSLTNECNSYTHKFGFTLEAYQAEKDVFKLRYLLDRLNLSNIEIYGPDVTSLQRTSGAAPYLDALLETPSYCSSINALSLHHYYVDGRTATINEFIDPNVYDAAKTLMDRANEIKAARNCNKPVYLTETASAYGGGAPELSNRYAGALMWLDQMALVALHGASRVNRQTFWAGAYALIDYREYEPTPGYWVSVLWKRLILGGVLNATVNENTNGAFRLYSHCAKVDGRYTSTTGAIVVVYVSLMNEDVALTITGYETQTYKLFLLSQNDLISNDVFLNGAQTPLALVNDDLPDIQPQTQNGGPINISPYGMGFVLIENANAAACP